MMRVAHAYEPSLRSKPVSKGMNDMNGFTSSVALLNDVPLRTWEGGEGPTLLFLHGAGGAADFFVDGQPAPFLAELAQSFRVLVTEHPGFGANERPAWLATMHDLAYFYLDYLQARSLRNVHLVGHSLGGWLALELAVRNTEHLASLTVAGAAGVDVLGVPKGDIFLWSRDDFARNMFRTPAAAQAYLARTMTPEQERIAARNRETFMLLASEPRLFDPHLHKWLHRISVPAHIIWAEDDAVLPRPYGEAIAGLIGNARLTILDGAGHLMQIDQPSAFGAAVSGFIRQSAATTRNQPA
ncbi:alpha/beta fold hydrolase [Bosea sp. NPDC003192]|uniref:alpha/beta fold hydrolase n=1 Tax=Bosea sp. NPDC003192 TaxID=3390551 RepID=UPI003D0465F0